MARIDLLLDVEPPRGLRAWLTRYTSAIVEAATANESAALSLTLTDDETIRRLNREHLGNDDVTDVLSFGLESDEFFPVPGGAASQIGDLVIALPTAERQAVDEGHSLRSELAHLVVHGVLHILGRDHDTPETERAMEQEERRLVAQVLDQLPERDRLGIRVPHDQD